jgi:hypothetical protein
MRKVTMNENLFINSFKNAIEKNTYYTKFIYLLFFSKASYQLKFSQSFFNYTLLKL